MNKLEGGLRQKGKINKRPLITIITVVFNGAKTVETTIKSVVNQTYRNFEYIIIDGYSTDGTLDIIKKYNSKIDYWISESDKGIYDAMNKGVLLAKGEYIYFLGCDDYLIEEEILKKLSSRLEKKYFDLFYCNIKTINDGKETINPNKEILIEDLKKGKKICHQGLFTKKKIIDDEGYFDLNYPIASDYNFICTCFNKGYKILYSPIIITFYGYEGISTIKKDLNETASIIRKHFGLYYYYRYLFIEKSHLIISKFLRKVGLLETFKKILRKIQFIRT